MTEDILLTSTRINTFVGEAAQTNASGFFFERGERLFLVTSRHVLLNEPTGHFPDRIEIDLHTDEANIAKSVSLSIPLYREGAPQWREGLDCGGKIDVAAIELDRERLPRPAVFRAFSPLNLQPDLGAEIGDSVLVIGFPLGFHDTLHHLPVARGAVIASSFGLRFQGEGYFLTDARTHRGASGAPVVMRIDRAGGDDGELPWRLLGIHSSRLDVGPRDVGLDEALGLNCAWYADILMTLTG
ncbi:S1 family peptidase [Methylocystis heyeri]|uniref:Serine protease n=1 Tax=Methylocystis heyeri TaxID=391905 RepID=A0A6B8KK18_9HYPH|nr:serine protease [Methylocystis heyeri]QGM46960.1 serine protease [Methylocystis heyeri]